jgi:hypothetical protein
MSSRTTNLSPQATQRAVAERQEMKEIVLSSVVESAPAPPEVATTIREISRAAPGVSRGLPLPEKQARPSVGGISERGRAVRPIVSGLAEARPTLVRGESTPLISRRRRMVVSSPPAPFPLVRRPRQLAPAAHSIAPSVRPPHKMGRESAQASARLNRIEDRFKVVASGRSSIGHGRRPRKIDPKYGVQLQLPL